MTTEYKNLPPNADPPSISANPISAAPISGDAPGAPFMVFPIQSLNIPLSGTVTVFVTIPGP